MNKKINILEIIIIVGIVLMIVLGIIYKLPLFDLFVGVIGLVAGLLDAKGIKYYVYAFLIQVVCYGIQCIIYKQYGLAIIQLLMCAPLYMISIFKLNKNKTNNNIIKIMPKKYYWNLIIVMSIIYTLYTLLLIKLGSKYPILNSFAAIFCIISTFLASKYYKDQWIFWFGYSLMCCVIWFLDYNSSIDSALIYLLMNIVFIIINISGTITWEKKYKIQLGGK